MDVGINSVDNGSIVPDAGLYVAAMLGKSGISEGGSIPPINPNTWNQLIAAGYSWDDMDIGGVYEKTWNELIF